METAISKNGTYTDYSIEQIEVIKNSVAKNTTDTELKYFLNVCKSTGLNPFMKEIWCYKDHRNNLLVFAGRDGFLSNAQKQEAFEGIRSCEVCENDSFVLDLINPKNNSHQINAKNRGKILGAYAIVFRKGGEPTISYVNFEDYNRGANAWKTHPAAMIKKVAETQALKLAFGMSGVQSEHEFEVIETTGTVIPLDHSISEDQLNEIKAELEQIEIEQSLNGYFKSLPKDLQSNETVINLFRTKKTEINANN